MTPSLCKPRDAAVAGEDHCSSGQMLDSCDDDDVLCAFAEFPAAVLTFSIKMCVCVPAGRKWFRHPLQAPGLYTGYAAQTLPGIEHALSTRDYKEAQEQVGVAALRVQAAAAFLRG